MTMKFTDTRLLAIDLDETLLRSDNTVSNYTKEIMNAVRGRGIDIVLATGRMYQTAEPVGKALGLGNVPMILFSGGVIQELESKHMIFERTVPLKAVHEAFTIAKYHNWHMHSYVNDRLLCHHQNAQSDLYERQTGARAEFLGDSLYDIQEEPNKLIVIEEPEHIDTIISKLGPTVYEYVELVRSQANFLEILPKHVSKGLALEHLVQHREYDISHVISFGNADNDVSMLSRTGYSVVVQNATAYVKSVAKDRCGHHDADGVAHWIEEHIL